MSSLHAQIHRNSSIFSRKPLVHLQGLKDGSFRSHSFQLWDQMVFSIVSKYVEQRGWNFQKLHSACLRKIMRADYEILASKKLQWSILLQILEAASKNHQLF